MGSLVIAALFLVLAVCWCAMSKKGKGVLLYRRPNKGGHGCQKEEVIISLDPNIMNILISRFLQGQPSNLIVNNRSEYMYAPSVNNGLIFVRFEGSH